MKTLIITSKNEKGCYDRIVKTWFQGCNKLFIYDIKNMFVSEVLYKVSPSTDCCVCLPPSINPDLPELEKTSIVIDEVQKIVEKLKDEKITVAPKELFLLIHSGDLFPLGDARRENGLLPISCFPQEHHKTLKKMVSDGNIFQFRHDRNAITTVLMGSGDTDISTLFNKLTKVILNQGDEQ